MVPPRAGPWSRREPLGAVALSCRIARAGRRAAASVAGAALLAAAAGLATAQEGALRIPLRSGEHGGYTRIALTLPETAGWRFGRSDGGYALVIERPGVVFDTGAVFGPIGRARLAAIAQVPPEEAGVEAPPGALRIDLACPCHAVAFATTAGVIAIDIRPGPPPAGSAFEVEISAAPSRMAGTGAGPAPRPAADRPPPAPPRPARIAALAPAADPATGDDAGPAVPSEADAPPPAATPQPLPGAVPADPAAGAVDPRIRTALEPVLGAPAVPSADATPAEPPSAEAAPPTEERAPDTADPVVSGAPPTGGDAAARPADPRLAAAQDDLLRGLAEAAGRGVIDLDGPLAEALAAARNPRRSREAEAVRDGSAADKAADGAAGAGQIRLRDPNADGRADTTAAGAPCIADAELDIGTWGPAEDPFGALADRRLALVGEFDRPDPAAVADLARAYLFAGFGAEARNALAAFAPAPQGGAETDAGAGGTFARQAAALATMGDVLDAKVPAEPHAFSGMEVCDGHAAMWAVLARPALAPGDRVDRGAVARAFAALPLHLRQLLAPDLTRRFIDAGDTHTAQRLRDILARPPGAEGGALDLLDARFDVAGSAPERGEAALRALAAEDGPRAAEALAELVDSLVRRGSAPDDETLTALAAAAREYRATPEGARLHQSLARGTAAAGDFDAALGAMLPADDPARGEIWEILATRGNDEALLRHAVAAAGRVAPGPPATARLDIAARLLALGFAESALGWIGAAEDERAQLLRARAELARGAADAALAALAGIGGEQAELLRAEALIATGAATEAAGLLAAAGDAEGSRRAALRAGDFATAAGGDDPIGAALAALADAGAAGAGATSTEDASDGTPVEGTGTDVGGAVPGPLAEGRALVARTAAQRAALAALIEAIGTPASRQADGAATAPAAATPP